MIRYALARWHRFVRGEDIFDAWPGCDVAAPVEPRRPVAASSALAEARRVPVEV